MTHTHTQKYTINPFTVIHLFTIQWINIDSYCRRLEILRSSHPGVEKGGGERRRGSAKVGGVKGGGTKVEEVVYQRSYTRGRSVYLGNYTGKWDEGRM